MAVGQVSRLASECFLCPFDAFLLCALDMVPLPPQMWATPHGVQSCLRML